MWRNCLHWVKSTCVEGRPKQARTPCTTSSQLGSETCCSSARGNPGTYRAISWSSLPPEMVEVILAKLSLIELARLSLTCGSFKAVYQERMAVQQKSYMELATKCFGLQRIACIIALIAHILSGKSLRRDLGVNLGGSSWCCVSADGVLHGPLPDPYHLARDVPRELGHFGVGGFAVAIHPEWKSFDFDFAPQESHEGGWSLMRVEFPPDCNGVIFTVVFSPDGDLQAVAMMHALLSEGLAQFLHDAGKWATIEFRTPFDDGVTAVELTAKITPLLPFAARYTPARDDEDVEDSPECIEVGVVASEANSWTASWLVRRLRRVKRLGRVRRETECKPQYALLRHVVE